MSETTATKSARAPKNGTARLQKIIVGIIAAVFGALIVYHAKWVHDRVVCHERFVVQMQAEKRHMWTAQQQVNFMDVLEDKFPPEWLVDKIKEGFIGIEKKFDRIDDRLAVIDEKLHVHTP